MLEKFLKVEEYALHTFFFSNDTYILSKIKPMMMGV
jgi:hypothetical protein